MEFYEEVEGDVYEPRMLQRLVEDDEMSGIEEGFMLGHDEAL
ncbi:MAG: hypothetical protein Q8R00_04730 [Candidatus Nanoarchaeia archaeon]|nr:hypothetical protein [Candidatus Nanoarchaeia archaeon]